MSVYAIGMKVMKGVTQPNQRPFWRIYFHAVDAEGKCVQFFGDLDQVANWVYVAGATVRRLEQLASDELMELPEGSWALLKRFFKAGKELRTILGRAK